MKSFEQLHALLVKMDQVFSARQLYDSPFKEAQANFLHFVDKEEKQNPQFSVFTYYKKIYPGYAG